MKRIKEIWKNRKLIWQGVMNTIFRKRYVEKIAAERLEICNTCEFLDVEGSDCAVTGTQPCCANCGCSLKFKTRSLASECPIGKWDAVEPEEDEEEVEEFDLETMDDYEKIAFVIEVLESCEINLSTVIKKLKTYVKDE